MNLEIKKIYLSSEKELHQQIDHTDTNTDVIVHLKNGEIYVASFFTYKNIKTLQTKHNESGEFNNGRYFWASNMLLIKSCQLKNIQEIITHLIEEGDFPLVFRKI